MLSERREVLKLVRDKKLLNLIPESEAGNFVRLNEMPMQSSILLKRRRLILRNMKAKQLWLEVIMGSAGPYSAEIIDLAGPNLSALVQRVFG